MSVRHTRIAFVILFVLAASLGVGSQAARAGVNREWVGPNGGVWSNANNWSPKGPPQNGDVLTFRGSTMSWTLNDIIGLQINGIVVQNRPTTEIRGETLGISGSIMVANDATPAFGGLIVFKNPVVFGKGSLAIYKTGPYEFSMHFASGLELQGAIVSVTGGLFRVTKSLDGHGSIVTNSNFRLDDSGSFDGLIQLLASVAPSNVCSLPGAQIQLNGAALEARCNDGVIGGLFGSGVLDNQAGVTLDGPAGETFAFNGTIKKPTVFNCCGQSTFVFSGKSESSIVQVDGGAMYLKGATFPATTPINVWDAKLGGYGTFGPVTIDNSTFALGAPADIGIAHMAWLGMTNNAKLLTTIRGATAGSGYGQIQALGAVDLTADPGQEPTLEVHFSGYTPPVGQAFTLIITETVIKGTFKGQPEGATATFDGMPFRVSHKGGAVVITRLASTASPTATASATATPTPPKGTNRRFVPSIASDR